MRKVLGICSVVLIVSMLMGCSTMVHFNSYPAEADIYVNDEYIGKTPISKKISNFVGRDPTLTVKKEGYYPIIKSLNKEVKVGALVGGLFLCWPAILWCYGPEANQYFNLQKVESNLGSSH